MYLANLHFPFFDILPYDMEATENVFGGGVRPRFLHVGNDTCVVTVDCHRVLRTREHSKLDDELP